MVGAVDGSMTARALHGWFQRLHAPPGMPSTRVLVPIFIPLYILIGTAAWLVWKRLGAARPLRLWGWQLAAHAAWAPAFFGLHSPALAGIVMVALLVLIGLTIQSFRRVYLPAAVLMVPYAGCCLYAAYLNVGFLLLNHA